MKLFKKNIAEKKSAEQREGGLKINKKSILWLSLVTLFLVLTSVAAYFFVITKGEKDTHRNNPDVLAVVGEKEIKKSDLNKKAYSKNFSGSLEKPYFGSNEQKKIFLDQLIEEEIVRQEAKKSGVTVSKSEIDGLANMEGGNPVNRYPEPKKSIALEEISNSLLKNKMRQKIDVAKEGDYLLFRFDKYYLVEDVSFPGEGDQAKIVEQKAYAKKIADQVYAKLKSKEINFEQAIEIVNNDPVISAKALEPIRTNIYGSFSGEEYISKEGMFSEAAYSGFYNQISTMNKGEISEPFVVSGYPTGDTTTKKDDIFYAIVTVNDTLGGEIKSKDGNYENWLEDQKVNYKVKAYYNKLDASFKDNNYSTKKINMVPEAHAATSVSCGISVSGTHYTQFKTFSYIRTASNTVERYANNLVSLKAAAGGKALLVGGNGSCGITSSYNTTVIEKRSYASDSTSPGEAPFYAAYSTDNMNWTRGYVYNCNEGSGAHITWHSNNPEIPNTNPDNDTWQLVRSSWTAAANGIAGQSYDDRWLDTNNSSGLYDNYDNNLYLRLDLGTSTSWANGTLVTKRALYVPEYKIELTTAKDGNGSGTVTSNPAGISCGTDCVEPFNRNSLVTLTATANTGSTFVGWSANCIAAGNTCTATMDVAKTVTATFNTLAPPPPPAQPTSLSCTAVPVGGDVPLRVQVTTTTNFAPSGSYNYNMGDGKATSTFSRTAAATDSFQYIYTTPGNFSITVSNPTSGLSATCPTGGINPTNPNDPNGGEVSP